jgi:hypothetical protein
VELKERLLGPDHPEVAVTVHNLAVLQDEQGHRREAEAGYRRAPPHLHYGAPRRSPNLINCRRHLAALTGS